jgi:hypothetical protein
MFIIGKEVDVMKEKFDKPLVLRTVYLNQERDEELRKMAFNNRMSKGDLIRRLLDFALQHKTDFQKGLGTTDTPQETNPISKNEPTNPKDKRNKLMPAPIRKKMTGT